MNILELKNVNLNLKKNGFARKEPFFRKLQRQEAGD
jgi:hypothetical protein